MGNVFFTSFSCLSKRKVSRNPFRRARKIATHREHLTSASQPNPPLFRLGRPLLIARLDQSCLRATPTPSPTESIRQPLNHMPQQTRQPLARTCR